MGEQLRKGPNVSALQHFRAPHGLAPGPGYSHAVTGRGRWVAISGQVALDEDGQLVGAGDLEAQARQVFANLDRALAAAGADRKSTRLNSSHMSISYAVFCLK